MFRSQEDTVGIPGRSICIILEVREAVLLKHIQLQPGLDFIGEGVSRAADFRINFRFGGCSP